MKKTNKGFSLVELIIVIAIMAILAGAIAPALIRYIDKSRRSNDVTSCKAIKTAVDAAMGSEDVYTYLTTFGADLVIYPGQQTGADNNNTDVPADTVIKVTIGGTFVEGNATATNGAVLWDGSLTVAKTKDQAKREIARSLGEKTPKIKYKKCADSPKSENNKAQLYLVNVNRSGTVTIAISGGAETIYKKQAEGSTTLETNDHVWLILPESCEYYQ